MKLTESSNSCSATVIYLESPAGKRRAAIFMAINHREICLCLLRISGFHGHTPFLGQSIANPYGVPNQRQQTGQSARLWDPLRVFGHSLQWMYIIRLKPSSSIITHAFKIFQACSPAKNAKSESITIKPSLWLLTPQGKLWVVAPICCCTSGIYKLTVPLKPDATWCCCL